MNCHTCEKEATQLCKGCKSVFYCGIECQQKDWMVQHYVTCGAEMTDLPNEIQQMIMIELSFEDLQNTCQSDPSMGVICTSDQFKRLYIDRDPERIIRVINHAIRRGLQKIVYSWGAVAFNRVIPLDDAMINSVLDLFTFTDPSITQWDRLLDFMEKFPASVPHFGLNRRLHHALEYAPVDIIDELLSLHGSSFPLNEVVQDPVLGFMPFDNFAKLIEFQDVNHLSMEFIWRYSHTRDRETIFEKTEFVFKNYPNLQVSGHVLEYAIVRGFEKVVYLTFTQKRVSIDSIKDISALFGGIVYDDSASPLKMAMMMMTSFKIDFGQLDQDRLEILIYLEDPLLFRYLFTHQTIWRKINHYTLMKSILDYKTMRISTLVVLHDIYVLNSMSDMVKLVESHGRFITRIPKDIVLMVVSSLNHRTLEFVLSRMDKLDVNTIQIAIRSAVLRKDNSIFSKLITHPGFRESINMKLTFREAILRFAENIAEYMLIVGLMRNNDLTEFIELAEKQKMGKLVTLMQQSNTEEPSDSKRTRVLFRIQ